MTQIPVHLPKTCKITAVDAVLELKRLGTATTARELAYYLGTTSRAVATALRGPVKDGRIKITYHRKTQQATYRYLRLNAKLPATVFKLTRTS